MKYGFVNMPKCHLQNVGNVVGYVLCARPHIMYSGGACGCRVTNALKSALTVWPRPAKHTHVLCVAACERGMCVGCDTICY
jgi:hypothetical protein